MLFQLFMPANRTNLLQQSVDGQIRARPPFRRSAHCVCTGGLKGIMIVIIIGMVVVSVKVSVSV